MQREMENKNGLASGAFHCLVLSYPGQGHINPMLQFSKRLRHEGVMVTVATTLSFCKSLKKVPPSIAIETISDGFDMGGLDEAESFEAYISRLGQVGPKSLADLVEKLGRSGHPVHCIVYNSFLPWALDVAKAFGIAGAAFFTQNLAVSSIYYHVHIGKLRAPLTEHEISLPELPKLEHGDLPSFFFNYEKEPAFLHLLADQFSNIENADWVLFNTFYHLEKEVANWMMKKWPKMRTIGPTIPSMFLDKRIKDDEDYGVAKFNSEECMEWLDNKPKGSVVYVSFGSLAEHSEEQLEEVACALKDSKSYFLWVVRASEESKLPKNFEKKLKKGLVVTWCSQLKVLAHEALGCFVTHCGWNSTLEALILGVPTIAIPYWSDQNTNAKLTADVWRMGIRAPVDDKNIVRAEALKQCIKEMMENEGGKDMKINAMHWKALAVESVAEEGSSHQNVLEFIKSFPFHKQHD